LWKRNEFGIPAKLIQFVHNGTIEVTSTEPDTKTVEFIVPSLSSTDRQGLPKLFSLTWIHPAFNAQFCHYYDETPGDLANFYVVRETERMADEHLDDLESFDDLVAWLNEVAQQVLIAATRFAHRRA
jgi:hypothetical protein